MPKYFKKKEERQYKHIKDSAKKRGRSEDRAEEIAAATVNKQRRKKGKTRNKTTSGTGNPKKGLEERSKQEFYNKAKQMKINGRSKMSKTDLAKAIRAKS